MRLSDKQKLFAELLGELIRWVYDETKHPGIEYSLSFGDAYRDPRVFGEFGRRAPRSYGRKFSNHKRRLAIDLNLFRKVNGRWHYCQSTNEHKALGEYWESLSPLCAWGGRFDDGNHYSLEHGGRR